MFSMNTNTETIMKANHCQFITLNYFSKSVFLKTLLAGGIAGAVSRTLVSPLERMKILFQVSTEKICISSKTANISSQTQVHKAGQAPKYTSMAQTLTKMWREEGMRGYFKGNLTNCVRVFPTSAIQYYSYEEYKKVMKEQKGVCFSSSSSLSAFTVMRSNITSSVNFSFLRLFLHGDSDITALN